MGEKNKTQYELSAGGITILQIFLTLKLWYKDEPKADWLMVRAVDAYDALPDLGPRPSRDSTEAENKAWAERNFQFEWTDKEKDAAKACIRFFHKAGELNPNKHTVAVMRLLGLLNPADE